MTARYGDFVLYRPPVKGTTMPLWLGPFLLLIVAVTGLILYLRRRGRRWFSSRSPMSSMRACRHCSAATRRVRARAGQFVKAHPESRVNSADSP